MKKTLLLIILVTASFSAFAANQWTGNKKVIQVQGLSTGGFLIYLDSEVDPGCTTAGTNSIYVRSGFGGVDEKGSQSLLSITLTAFTTGHDVSIMYDDSDAYCNGKYVVIKK